MNTSFTTSTPSATPDGAPVLLTVSEACEALKISRWSLYQLINKRRLKTVRIKRRRLITPADLTALIEELREEGANDGR